MIESKLVLKMILGIESTAHTFGTAVVDEKGRLVCQKREMVKPEMGLIPRDLFEHHYGIADKILKETLAEAEVSEKELTAVAFSQGPGIPNALRVGAVVARTLSLKNNIPCVPVNHCIAHIESAKIQTQAKDFVVAFASGANTQIVLEEDGKYRIVGETLDIGLGNMLDGFGRKLGLGFPAGPKIDEMYFKGKKLVELPYAVKGTDLVFSGLLTSAVEKIGKETKEDWAGDEIERGKPRKKLGLIEVLITECRKNKKFYSR